MHRLTALEDIESAREKLPAAIRRTPIVPLSRESAEIGRERLFLKCENLQVRNRRSLRLVRAAASC